LFAVAIVASTREFAREGRTPRLLALGLVVLLLVLLPALQVRNLYEIVHMDQGYFLPQYNRNGTAFIKKLCLKFAIPVVAFPPIKMLPPNRVKPLDVGPMTDRPTDRPPSTTAGHEWYR
jgi:hypothetical protein